MNTTTDVEKLNYEQALAELDQLIAQLERGDINLDEAIRAYQRGSQLAQRCAELLDHTEAQVTQLVVGPHGTPQERPFSAAAHEEAAAQPPATAPADRVNPRPVAPPPPTAPVRARTAGQSAGTAIEPPPAADPGLFPGLDPNPASPPREDTAEFDLDDIPF
jgi:exodeoxyribonuclease VII small subunit